MQITLTRSGMTPKTLDVIPGTLNQTDNCIDAGSGVIPKIRTACGVTGSCQVFLDDSFNYAEALSLISPVGAGNTALSGAVTALSAIIDVSIDGDGVQIATVSWKGSKQ